MPVFFAMQGKCLFSEISRPVHIVIGDEWYGIVNGQNPSIFNGVTALFRIGKMVSGLLFLYCS